MLTRRHQRVPPSRSTPTGWRSVALLGAAGLLVLAAAAPAQAHARLISVTPGDGATLPESPASLVLTFNEPMESLGARVVASGPSGEVAGLEPPQFDATVVTQALPADLAAGAYTARWRVVSADGHPVEGESRFTTAGPAATAGSAGSDPSSGTSPSAPTAVAAPSTAAPIDPAEAVADASGLPGWVLAIGGIAVAALGLGAVLGRARRRGVAE